jgi:hypothetical protein
MIDSLIQQMTFTEEFLVDSYFENDDCNQSYGSFPE